MLALLACAVLGGSAFPAAVHLNSRLRSKNYVPAAELTGRGGCFSRSTHRVGYEASFPYLSSDLSTVRISFNESASGPKTRNAGGRQRAIRGERGDRNPGSRD